MDHIELLKTLGQVAGIGGIALGSFLLIFRDVVRRQIFGQMNRVQTYRLFRLIVILTWSIAVLGIGAWVYANSGPRPPSNAALESQVTLQAGTYDAAEIVEKLATLTGGVVVDRNLSAKLTAQRVRIASNLNSVSLRTALDRIFAEVNIQIDYAVVNGTIVIREKGASG